MSATRKQRIRDHDDRLREAEGAAESLSDQGATVDRQLSLVGKLTAGWRKVHETNHLAQLFREEGHLG